MEVEKLVDLEVPKYSLVSALKLSKFLNNSLGFNTKSSVVCALTVVDLDSLIAFCLGGFVGAVCDG